MIKYLAEELEQVSDLAAIQRAIVREKAIREGMARTGEGREVVAEALDAMQSMDQEAVLDLTEGAPTTLVDALTRYVRILETWDEVLPRDRVLGDLSAILEYPWPNEEALVQLHEPNAGVRLEIREGDDRDQEIRVGGSLVATVNWEDAGSGGQVATKQVARAVHRAVLVRVLADREHHIQLNAAQTEDFRQWLARPNGSSLGDGQRLTVDAVSGGGVLIRTRPYVYQRPGNSHLAEQARLDQRRGTPAPWCGNDGPRDAAAPGPIGAYPVDAYGTPPTDPGDLPAQQV